MAFPQETHEDLELCRFVEESLGTDAGSEWLGEIISKRFPHLTDDERAEIYAELVAACSDAAEVRFAAHIQQHGTGS